MIDKLDIEHFKSLQKVSVPLGQVINPAIK